MSNNIPLSNTQKILLGAIKILEKDGWHQGGLTGPGNSVCAMGAMSKSCVQQKYDAEELSLAMVFLRQAIHSPYIARWNDSSERTKDEVITALHRAIISPKGFK